MRKKKVALLAVAAATCTALLAGCGEDPVTQPSTPTSVSSAAESRLESSDAPVMSSTSSEEKSEVPTEKYYFKDNVAVLEDVTIKITDYKVIGIGEKGNEYGDKPVIAFWYTTTNTSKDTSKEINPMMAWIAVFTAIQDNNPNAINEIDVALLPDDRFLHTQSENIKPGGTVENAMAYELDDLETPVTLKATKGTFGKDLGEQTFNIK